MLRISTISLRFQLQAYDVVAGRQLLKSSYFIGKEKSLEKFPMLKKESLKGAIVYYDGQHNDARMCLSIGLTGKLWVTDANISYNENQRHYHPCLIKILSLTPYYQFNEISV